MRKRYRRIAEKPLLLPARARMGQGYFDDRGANGLPLNMSGLEVLFPFLTTMPLPAGDAEASGTFVEAVSRARVRPL